MSTASEIRQLVTDLQAVTRASPVVSLAHPIISNTCDHLSAIARIHEMDPECENERLRATLKECADNLERELKECYGLTRFDYPEVRRQYNLDMEPVAKARRLLRSD